MKLKELQKQFAIHLYKPKQEKIFSEIRLDKVLPKNRLQIYRNNVFGNFDSVLEMIYPTVKDLLGKEQFQELCSQYHQKHHSKSGNLDEYGKYFAKFIKKHKMPYLSDIAGLEWLYHLAYFSKDIEKFAIEKFQKLKEKDLFKVKFKLHPSAYLFTSKYPIYSIWKNKKANLKTKKEFILIERAILKTGIHNLLEPEFLFLKHIKNGKNLYQIYQNLEKKFVGFDIGSLINKFISNGTIASYEL